MLDSVILEKIASPVDEDVFLALKKISTLQEISFEEAEALLPLLIPYLSSKNQILNAYAKEALARVKRLQPKLQSTSDVFTNNLDKAEKEQDIEKENTSNHVTPSKFSEQVQPSPAVSVRQIHSSNVPRQGSFYDPAAKLFCEIAVDLEFITNVQADKALIEQKVDRELGNNKPIGSYLFAAGIISREQIEKILRFQEKYCGQQFININSIFNNIRSFFITNQGQNIGNSSLEKAFTFNLWASIGLLIAFFLPWVTFAWQSVSGYSLSQVGSYGNLAWFIPVVSCLSIYFSINKNPIVIFTATLLGFCPLLFIGYAWYSADEIGLNTKIFHFLGIGAYLSIIIGVALVIYNLPKLFSFYN